MGEKNFQIHRVTYYVSRSTIDRDSMEEAKRRCLALVGGGNARREGLTPRRGRSEKYAILNNFLASFGAVYKDRQLHF